MLFNIPVLRDYSHNPLKWNSKNVTLNKRILLLKIEEESAVNTFQLTCFLTVAETLNFARAAERVNITQPAVTHQIRSLEAELGVKLFLRTTHFVKLTQAGLLFVEDARTIITTSLRAKKRFETMHEQAFSMFYIGCHMDGYLQFLPEVLRTFSVLYPDIHPHIHMAPSQSFLFRLLEDEKADIVFGIREPTVSRVPGIYKELVRSPIACICAADHPLATRRSVTRTDLKNERLILFDVTKSSFFSAQVQGQMIGGRRPADLYFCESTLTAMILAKAGYGVFFLPEILAPVDNALATLPIVDAGTESFGMYYRSLQSHMPLKDFVRLIKAKFE